MANTLTSAILEMAEKAVPVLRENSVVPRLIMNDVDPQPSEKGQVIVMGKADAGTVRDVTPGQYGTNIAVTATRVSITLDQWRESAMNISDKEYQEVMEGYIPAQAEECLRALVNDVDTKLLTGMAKAYPNYGGTAGTTPFATNLAAFASARTGLNRHAAPMRDRYVVLDENAEGNALILGNFLKADERGDQGGIIEGNIGRKLGADWYMDQNVYSVATHTLNVTTAILTVATEAVGQTTIALDRASLTGTIKTGNLLSFTGSETTYVCTATCTAATNAISVPVFPAVATAIASGVTCTVIGAHVANLLFHRKSYAMASRPLASMSAPGGGNFTTIVDPVSGLTVRLEITREHRQHTLAWDILYGYGKVRAEWGAKILG